MEGFVNGSLPVMSFLGGNVDLPIHGHRFRVRNGQRRAWNVLVHGEEPSSFGQGAFEISFVGFFDT